MQLLYQGKPLRAILVLFLGNRRGLRWWWCFSQSSPPAIAITNGGLQHKWISRYSRVNWSTFGAIMFPKIHLCSHFKGESLYFAEASPVLKHHRRVHFHLWRWEFYWRLPCTWFYITMNKHTFQILITTSSIMETMVCRVESLLEDLQLSEYYNEDLQHLQITNIHISVLSMTILSECSRLLT